MPSLDVKSFEELVDQQAAAVQAASDKTFDFSIGSIPRALVEGSASQGMWIQYLLEFLASITRAATSAGVNLDTWMADFDFERLSPVPAEGLVTFSRFTSTVQAVIDVGKTVQTTDGSQDFAVIADTSNPLFDENLNAYIIPVGTPSADIITRATVAGAAGNVASNTVTVISSPIPGIDTVNNLDPFTNGRDTENDPDFRSRFILYINSLSKATKDALTIAIRDIPEVERFALFENQDPGGGVHLGFFYAVIDDGTGNPPQSLIDQVKAAMGVTRGLTICFDVIPPVVKNVPLEATLTVVSTADENVVKNNVTVALQNYINTLSFGVILPYTRVFDVIYDADESITNVTGVLVDNGTADLPAVNNQVFVPGVITIGFTA